MKRTQITNQKIHDLINQGKDMNSIYEVALRYEGLYLAYFSPSKDEKIKKKLESLEKRIIKQMELCQKRMKQSA